MICFLTCSSLHSKGTRDARRGILVCIFFIYSYPFLQKAGNNFADNTEATNAQAVNGQSDLSHFTLLYKQLCITPVSCLLLKEL